LVLHDWVLTISGGVPVANLDALALCLTAAQKTTVNTMTVVTLFSRLDATTPLERPGSSHR
jgi:hypothetical protein